MLHPILHSQLGPMVGPCTFLEALCKAYGPPGVVNGIIHKERRSEQKPPVLQP